MENEDQPQEDVMMDFESGIDTWIIEKDDSACSFSSIDKSRRECKVEKNMNKENIKLPASSSDGSSLRSFRKRKSVSYEEISSESEGESKREDDENQKFFGKKRSYASTISKTATYRGSSTNTKKEIESLSSEETSSESKRADKEDQQFNIKRRPCTSIFAKTFGSCSSPNNIKREMESLSSEEISSILSEIDDSKDGSSENNRETLLSIENVSSSIDSKTDSQSSSEMFCRRCKRCKNIESCKCNAKKAERLYGVHKKSFKKLPNGTQTEENISSEKCIKYKDMSFSSSKIKQEVIVVNVESLDKAPKKYKQLGIKNYFNGHEIRPSHVTGKILSVNKTFNMELKVEKPSKADVQRFTCDKCGYLSCELLIHKSHQILFHSEETELKCEYCEFKTSQCASLATHIRVHFRMDCPYCDYYCSLKSSLRKHLQMYHKNALPYSCIKCNYSCKSQTKFLDHLKMHTVKKYQCSDCNKFFSTKQSLKVHTKKHFMTKNKFKCSQCDLHFSQKQNLKLHVKCHENLNVTYFCSSCNVSFHKKYDFINHSKTHMVTLKTFKCDKCESTFSQGNQLKLHMRVHSIKCIKCQYCTFQCSDPSEIENHTCISVNKLYNVQKRPLNFEGVEREKKTLRSFDSKTFNSESNDFKKSVKKRPKVLSVRRNLRSFKSETKNNMKNDKLKSKPKTSQERRGRPRKLKVGKEVCTQVRKNNTNGARCINKPANKGEISMERQKRKPKKIRKDQLSKGLTAINLLFGKKQTKEMLIEPSPFVLGNFVECYYQSQQPQSAMNLQQHEERHLRRPSLLSCRFCNYKTNSERLLKCHVNKIHAWDPAVVNKLFRP